MNLQEIESEADGLMYDFLHPSAATRLRNDIAVRLAGLRDLAQIKRVVAQASPALCTSRSRGSNEACVLPAGHEGRHTSKGSNPLRWTNVPLEPNKPDVDRLHELVSYAISQSNDLFHQAEKAEPQTQTRLVAESKVYDEWAEKLQAILMEGNLWSMEEKS